MAKIFERHNTSEYNFTIDKREQKELSKRTLDNALYLSTSSNWNYKKTMPAFEWFTEGQRVITHEVSSGYTAKLFNDSNDMAGSIKEFISQADVGILDLSIAIKNISEATIPKGFPDDLKKLILGKGGQTAEIKAVHMSKDIEGKGKKMEFDIEEESEGTIKMFNFAGPFIDVLKNGRILIIDEMDTKLHPLLTKYLVNLFHTQNKNNAQLIFTTHNTYLLREKIFRKDQIWFTSKQSDQSTDLYSLYEYKARSDEDIEKRYLAGRYGAVPLLL